MIKLPRIFARSRLKQIDRKTIAHCYARCFREDDGDLVLNHLCASYLDRTISTDKSDQALWHQEGARHVVLSIFRMIEEGRGLSHDQTLIREEENI